MRTIVRNILLVLLLCQPLLAQNKVNLATQVKGSLPVGNGGTGQSTTATSGRYLKGDGSLWGTSSGAASGTGSCTNQFIRGLNSDAAPTCATVTSTDTSGTFPASAHNLFSATHGDTVAASPVLGDVIYGDATPNWTKLAGNITTTKKYLSQTGTAIISAVPAWAQVAFADLSGSATCAQLPALTGDSTTVAGNCAVTAVNLPDGETAAGHILFTDIAAPASPGAGKLKIFGDSTDLRFHDKNAAGTIGTTVVADTGAANNFLTAVSASGVISKAQPSAANLSNGTSGSGAVALVGSPTFTTQLTTPVLVSGAADPADAGVIRLGNAEIIGWEASPAGTDVSLTVDSTNHLNVTESGAILYMGGAVDVRPSAVTVNTNTTAAQNMMSFTLAAGAMNVAGKVLKIRGAGEYTTKAGQTPTITIDIQIGGVTQITWTSAATTASATDIPWIFNVTLDTRVTGASGRMETHGALNLTLGTTAGAASTVYLDTNTAASPATDLTIAETVVARITFSTNTSPANSNVMRQMVSEITN